MQYHIQLTPELTREIDSLIVRYGRQWNFTPQQIVNIILENVLMDTAYAPEIMLETHYYNEKKRKSANK